MAHFGKRARDPSPSLFLFPKQSAQPTFNMVSWRALDGVQRFLSSSHTDCGHSLLQRASPARLGGGAQYPYPKEVWSPCTYNSSSSTADDHASIVFHRLTISSSSSCAGVPVSTVNNLLDLHTPCEHMHA